LCVLFHDENTGGAGELKTGNIVHSRSGNEYGVFKGELHTGHNRGSCPIIFVRIFILSIKHSFFGAVLVILQSDLIRSFLPALARKP
jgi:hypothetical protein